MLTFHFAEENDSIITIVMILAEYVQGDIVLKN